MNRESRIALDRRITEAAAAAHNAGARPDIRTVGPCELCLLDRCDRCNGYTTALNVAGAFETVRCGHEHRRNPHCSRCGDTRGGMFGHEISECRWNPRPDPNPTQREESTR